MSPENIYINAHEFSLNDVSWSAFIMIFTLWYTHTVKQLKQYIRVFWRILFILYFEIIIKLLVFKLNYLWNLLAISE